MMLEGSAIVASNNEAFDQWEYRAQRLITNLKGAAVELEKLVEEERAARRRWREQHPDGEGYPDDGTI